MTASSASTAIVNVCQNGCTYSLNNPPPGGVTVNGVSSSVINGTDYIWILSSYGNNNSTSTLSTDTIDLTSVSSSDPSTNNTITLSSSISAVNGYYMTFAPDSSGKMWILLLNPSNTSNYLYESDNNGVIKNYTCSSLCGINTYTNNSTFTLTVAPNTSSPTLYVSIGYSIYRIGTSGSTFSATQIYSGGGSCSSGSQCWYINGLSTDTNGNVWASGTYNSGNGGSAVMKIPQNTAANATGVVADSSINYYCNNTSVSTCQKTTYTTLSFPSSFGSSFFSYGGAENTSPSKLVIDNKNNIWIGGGNVVELLTNTSPPTALTCQGGSCTGPVYNGSYMIAVSPQNSSISPNYPAWISVNSGNTSSSTGSAIVGFSNSNTGQKLTDVSYCDFSVLQNSSSMNGCTQYLGFAGNTPQYIALDTQGDVWMVNSSTSQLFLTEFVSAAN